MNAISDVAKTNVKIANGIAKTFIAAHKSFIEERNAEIKKIADSTDPVQAMIYAMSDFNGMYVQTANIYQMILNHMSNNSEVEVWQSYTEAVEAVKAELTHKLMNNYFDTKSSNAFSNASQAALREAAATFVRNN